MNKLLILIALVGLLLVACYDTTDYAVVDELKELREDLSHKDEKPTEIELHREINALNVKNEKLQKKISVMKDKNSEMKQEIDYYEELFGAATLHNTWLESRDEHLGDQMPIICGRIDKLYLQNYIKEEKDE